LSSEKVKRFISNYFTRLKGTKIALKGRDLKEMGYPPGPLYKKIFNGLLKVRLNNLARTREDEVRFVQETFGDRANRTYKTSDLRVEPHKKND
ncbi:hypothetical protein ACFL9T_05465, partial [Thermodesulfobacteriota bacterium]